MFRVSFHLNRTATLNRDISCQTRKRLPNGRAVHNPAKSPAAMFAGTPKEALYQMPCEFKAGLTKQVAE